MQNLEVISLNLWQILISLANLIIIFIILKKLMYGPVRDVLAKRQVILDGKYREADEAKRSAEESRALWQEKLEGAKDEAERMIKDAASTAERRGDKIIADAKVRADGIVRQAEAEAELEKKKAAEGIKREIVDVSAALAEKMLEREIREEDHRVLIDSFIRDIGDKK
ncbi:MAG: F0F1 ATP synthase subunit B [Clostridia bacterium]|nr:F0F1 ATP synthase subunit B [Clostridia bacterium]